LQPQKICDTSILHLKKCEQYYQFLKFRVNFDQEYFRFIEIRKSNFNISILISQYFGDTLDQADWILIKGTNQNTGKVPSNYVAYKNDEIKFVLNQFLFSDLDQEKAAEYISWAPDGAFLICNANPSNFPIQVILKNSKLTTICVITAVIFGNC